VSEATIGVQMAALASFSEAFEGEIVLPGSAGYDAARIVWNGMIDRHPAAVARCDGVDDVIRTIRFAREQDLAIAVRSGGHSVGGFSTCDDGIVIDLSLMRGVDVDAAQRTAKVNGGALLGELDRAAQAVGLACPVGVVGHTGVAGLTLGGGMGRLQRRFGFTIDNLLSVDLVTADGERLHVSEEEHPDLFWGMRGAGPNFGIVTAFEFRLHEVGPDVVQGAVAFPASRAHEVADRYREYLETAPDEEALTFAFVRATEEPPFPPGLAGRTVVIVGATHSGSPEDAGEVLRPLRDAEPLFDTFTLRPYLDVQADADEDMAWGKRFAMKGGFLSALKLRLRRHRPRASGRGARGRLLGRPVGAGRCDRARRGRRDGVHRTRGPVLAGRRGGVGRPVAGRRASGMGPGHDGCAHAVHRGRPLRERLDGDR
jgi:FAD/FMN-containing dehydrogenase